MGDNDNGKKIEPNGSEGTVWFIRFADWTTSLTDLTPIRPLFCLNDWNRDQSTVKSVELTGPIQFLKPWLGLTLKRWLCFLPLDQGHI